MIRSPAIAAIVAGFVALDEELAQHEPDGDVYRSDGPLPPRTSRERFNRICRSGLVADAERIDGRGAGYWQCTREAWHQARARKVPALRLVENAPQSDRERAREMLAAAGFRRTK
jgi:hypothetical protein